jgi:translation initiation factor 1
MASTPGKRRDGIVYSTRDLGPDSPAPSGAGLNRDNIVRVGRETKGRKGAGVTVVIGAPVDGKELLALAKELKKKCGVGGTLRESVIEVQGDKRDQVIQILEKRGWNVKRVGG